MSKIACVATVVLFGLTTTACVTADAVMPLASDASPNARRSVDPARTTVRMSDAVLDVDMRSEPGRLVVHVHYRLGNTSSTTPLAVFDRGDAHDAREEKVGDVGAPSMLVTSDGVEILHKAFPLPDPSPTSPPTPIAMRLDPGGTLEGNFSVTLPIDSPTRVRWCLGHMDFDERYFDFPGTTQHGQIWLASFAVADVQTASCTPWYDMASGVFEP